MIPEEGAFTYAIFDANGLKLEVGDCSKSCLVGEHLAQGVYLVNIQNLNDNKYMKVVKNSMER